MTSIKEIYSIYRETRWIRCFSTYWWRKLSSNREGFHSNWATWRVYLQLL